MLKVSDSIRNAYNQYTTQRKSYIQAGDNSFFVQNLDVLADAYDEGNVIGNAIAKIAKFDIETEYVKGLDEFELFDGIWTGEKYEYVSLGTFKLFEEQGTDEFFSSITSYDKLVLFNKPYDNTNVSFPISLYDFLKEICSQANVELETKRIANGDKILFQNLFVEGETLKQILKAICQISGNFAKIKNDKLVLGLYDYDSYIATGNEIVLEDVVEEKTKIKQYGYTKQDGTPTPDTPVEIEVGRGKNLLSVPFTQYNANNLRAEIPNFKAGTYTFSFKGSLVATWQVTARKIVNGTQTQIKAIYNGYSLTFTLDEEATLQLEVYRTGILLSDISEEQLEKGSVATSYLPYNTIESKSTSNNLLNITNVNEVLPLTKDGLTMSLNSDGTFHLEGTKDVSGWTTFNFKINNLILKKGITYYSTMILATYTSSGSWVGNKSGVITPTEDYVIKSGYFQFNQLKEYDEDIIPMVVFGSEEPTTYEPYKESSIQYNLGDNFLADKDYIENGVLNKNVSKIVLNGSETWTLYSNNDEGISFALWKNGMKLGFGVSLCDKYKNIKQAWGSNYKNSYGIYSDHIGSYVKFFRPPNADITTVEQWKAWLNETPITMYYELETPEQISLETTGELRTFEPYTIITNDLDSEMEVEYGKYIEIDKDELYQPEYKRTTWKINKVVLGMKDVEGEFVAKQDDEDVNANGTHQLVINDNPFVYTQQLREEYIGELFERIKGFGYVAFESGFEGVPYYELGDLIKIEDKKSIILRYNLQSPKGLESTFSAPSIIDSVIEYTQTPNILEQKIRSTELRVDKAEGNIIGITKQTTEIRDNLNKNYYTIEQANTLIQNAETGVTNTFSEAGGNNVFRNTGLWFANSGEDAETKPYEFWEGKANEGNNDKATNYRSILLGKGSFIQDVIEVPNGNYSISFYYRKLITSAIASVVINDKEYELNSLEIKQFYTGEQNIETGEYIVDPIVVSNNHIKIEFKCDALNGVEVYDLMCNKGSVKLAYSQNQNETTTSTVNISKGITITSSAKENTKLKADYDGIRVLDGNNNPKTKFTDKGAETDELVVRRKATITGLLQQEVDDQTWVTKI